MEPDQLPRPVPSMALRLPQSRTQTPTTAPQLSDLDFGTSHTGEQESEDEESERPESPSNISPTSKLGHRFTSCGIGGSELPERPFSRSKNEEGGYESDESLSTTPRSLRSARRPADPRQDAGTDPRQDTGTAVAPASRAPLLESVDNFIELPFDLQFWVFNFLAAEDLARLRGVCRGMEARVQETVRVMFLEHFGVWPEHSRRLKTDRLFWALKRVHHLNPKAAAELWFWGAGCGFTKWLRRTVADASIPTFRDGVNCHCVKENGMTALHLAIKHEQMEVIEFLIGEAGVDCNAGDKKGYRPLHAACLKKNEDVVRLLLAQEETDIDATDKQLRTCLYVASEKGCVGLVELLIERGADPSINNATNMSPLYTAAEKGRADVVRLLLQDDRIEVSLTANTGKSPLYVATEKNKPDVVRLLLEAGADVRQQTSRKKIPLYVAAELSFTQVAKELLPYTEKRDLFWETTYGTTPMLIAEKQTNKVIHNMFKAFCSRRKNAVNLALTIADGGQGQGMLAMGDLRSKGKTGGKVDYRRVLEQKDRPATPRFASEMLKYEDHNQARRAKRKAGPTTVPFQRSAKVAQEQKSRLMSAYPDAEPPKKRRRRAPRPKPKPRPAEDEEKAPAPAPPTRRRSMNIATTNLALEPDKPPSPPPKKSAKRRRPKEPAPDPPAKRFHFNPSRMYEDARKRQEEREEKARAAAEEERRKREAKPATIDKSFYSRLVKRPSPARQEPQNAEEEAIQSPSKRPRWSSNPRAELGEEEEEEAKTEETAVSSPMTRGKFSDFMERQEAMRLAHRQKKLERLEQEKNRLLAERESVQRRREAARKRAAKMAEKAKREQAERRAFEAKLEAQLANDSGGIHLPPVPGAEMLVMEEADSREAQDGHRRRNSLPDIFAMRRAGSVPQLRPKITLARAAEKLRPKSSRRSSKSARAYGERALAVRPLGLSALGVVGTTVAPAAPAPEPQDPAEAEAQKRAEGKRRRAQKRRKEKNKLMAAYGLGKKRKRRRSPAKAKRVQQPEAGSLTGLLSVSTAHRPNEG